jgi:hypothetical protein
MESMARRARVSVGTSLQGHKVFPHMVSSPRLITSEFGNVIPVIIRWQCKVHGIGLSRTTERSTSGIKDTKSKRISGDLGQDFVYSRLCIIRRIQPVPKGSVGQSVRVFGVSLCLGLILVVVHVERPSHARIFRNNIGHRWDALKESISFVSSRF